MAGEHAARPDAVKLGAFGRPRGGVEADLVVRNGKPDLVEFLLDLLTAIRTLAQIYDVRAIECRDKALHGLRSRGGRSGRCANCH